MNRLETWMMNNPLRERAQREHAAPLLAELGGRLAGGKALEPGCGRGVGVECLLDQLGADRVDAFDLDPAMVDLARRRLARRGDRVRLWVGGLEQVEQPDASYDAAALFGVLHHLPDWRSALLELKRLIRPGGLLLAEESCSRFIDHPLFRRLLDHPRHDRFSAGQLASAIEGAGFSIVGRRGVLDESIVWIVARRAG